MTTDLESFQAAVAEGMRQTFETDREPDRWAVITLLSQLGVGYDGPRVSPSSHEEAVIRLVACSDVENLGRLYPLFTDTVRAYVMYAFQPGGLERLVAIAKDGPDPDEVLVREAQEAYSVARVGGEHLDGQVAIDVAGAGIDASAYRAVERCAQMVPKLAGALDRTLAELRDLRRRS